MHRLLGLETEYGLYVEGRGAADMMQESIALVRSYQGPCVKVWNHRAEDPRRDMRGFSVDMLSTDPVDSQFDDPSAPRLSVSEERSDRVLPNGARLYNDHGHPEYSTPECSSIMDLVAHDCAGERIVLECARRRGLELRRPVVIYKNNTDLHGASYGTHEDYLMRRDVSPEELIAALIPFLVTRQVYAGAGKVGVEGERSDPLFQLSQRADFMAVEASVDTLHNRPIMNTRDEPHADPRKYRRLHVICGDANMSQWATAMKVGTTALVLRLLESGWRPLVRLEDPVKAIKSVSRDQTLRWLVPLADGRMLGATEIQRLYLSEARAALQGVSHESDWILDEWDLALDALEKDLLELRDRVDWVAKRAILEEYMSEEGVDWDAPILKSLDLAYHDLDPEMGLQRGLEQAGAMRRLVSEERVRAALECPPTDTRAFLRGLFVRRFNDAVENIGWSGVVFRNGHDIFRFDMGPLVEENCRLLNEEVSSAHSLDALMDILRRPSQEPEQSAPDALSHQ